VSACEQARWMAAPSARGTRVQPNAVARAPATVQSWNSRSIDEIPAPEEGTLSCSEPAREEGQRCLDQMACRAAEATGPISHQGSGDARWLGGQAAGSRRVLASATRQTATRTNLE
jgi:hypothetical protein